MLGIVHSYLDGFHVAADVNGGYGGKIRVSGMAGLVHSTVFQLVNGLAHGVVCQSGGLLVPLVLGAGIGLHAVGFAQLVLGDRGFVGFGIDGTGVGESHGGAQAVDDTVGDDAVIVHGDGNQGHVKLHLAVGFAGIGALDHGNDGQTGLDRALGCRLGCRLGSGGVAAGGAGAVRVNHGGTGAASEQADHQHQSENDGKLLHVFSSVFVV